MESSGTFVGRGCSSVSSWCAIARRRSRRERRPRSSRIGCERQGILLGTDGPYHNVIKIRPPMPFDIEDADLLIEAFDESLTDLS